MLGILPDELAEAASVVVLTDQTAHAIDTVVEVVTPAAKLLRAGVAALQAVGNRVRGELSRFQRQQDAGRIQRVEESEGIADQHPAVPRDLLRAVRIVAG